MYWSLAWDFLFGEWKVVKREEAQQSRFYGFGGWLLVFYIGAVFATVSTLFEVFTVPAPEIVQVFGNNVELARTILLLNVLLGLPFLVLAPVKHRLMPRLFLAGLWVGTIIFAAVIDMPGNTNGMIFNVALVVLMAALTSSYILRSKRVNATYLNRIPAGSSVGESALITDDEVRLERRKRILFFFVGFLVIGAIAGIFDFLFN